MKTVFMGNHTVGVIVLKEFLCRSDVAAVFAHPDHPDDGTLYESVKDTAHQAGVPVYQYSGKGRDKVTSLVESLCPDLLVIADYRYLLKEQTLAIPRLGAINFHPSLLPKYRGRAPVNWAIINGEERCGLSVHFIDEGMDTGDIIFQDEVSIAFTDTIKDIHDKLFPLYRSLAVKTAAAFEVDSVPRRQQDHAQATVYPRRTPADGLIEWKSGNESLYNFIRAITYPYPGAFSFYDGRKYLIWASQLDDSSVANAAAGTVVRVTDEGIAVQTGKGVLTLTSVQEENQSSVNLSQLPFSPGGVFSNQAEPDE